MTKFDQKFKNTLINMDYLKKNYLYFPKSDISIKLAKNSHKISKSTVCFHNYPPLFVLKLFSSLACYQKNRNYDFACQKIAARQFVKELMLMLMLSWSINNAYNYLFVKKVCEIKDALKRKCFHFSEAI